MQSRRPRRRPYGVRTHSSVGQSSGLIIRRSWDHAPLGPQQQSRGYESSQPLFLLGSFQCRASYGHLTIDRLHAGGSHGSIPAGGEGFAAGIPKEEGHCRNSGGGHVASQPSSPAWIANPTSCRQCGESRSQTAITAPFKHPAQRQRGFKCRIKLRPELCSCRILLRCRPETFAKGLACLRTNEADTIPSVPTGGPADPRVFRLPESETVLSTIRPPQQNPPCRRPSLRGMQAAIACSF